MISKREAVGRASRLYRAPARPPWRARWCLASLVLGLVAVACSDSTAPDRPRTLVSGTVRDAQANTRLFFYDEELNELQSIAVQVRQDGSYGPLSFFEGDFLGAGTASGFTTGEFVAFTISGSDSARIVDFDLNPITIPLAVGNRWTYDERVFAPAPATATIIVEITGQAQGEGVPAVFTVEERRVDPGTGTGPSSTYFLAQDASGIRKSADAVIDQSDELLLRLPATLGTSWSTVDLASGAPLQKRITGFACDDNGCVENNDFTIAQEPAGIFMSVSERHVNAGQVVVTVFSDVGIVDTFVQNASGGALVLQRKLASFTSAASPPVSLRSWP